MLGIAWGQTDNGLIGGTETLGVVVDIIDAAVGHVLDVMGQCRIMGRNLQQTVFKALVREILLTGRIHNADAIDDEAIGIHVGSGRTEGDGPETGLGIALHRVATSELHIDEYLLGLVVTVTEGHRAVGVTGGGSIRRELPPVEAHVTTHFTEAEVEVVDASGTLDLGLESLVVVKTSSVGNADGTDDRSLTTIETQSDSTLALGGSCKAEALGTQSEINAAQTDILVVVDVIDIHVTLAGRARHIGDNTCVGNTYLGSLETVAPGHRLCFHAPVGIEGMELLHGLLVEPVGHLSDGTVGKIGYLRCRDTAALMVDESLQVHQVVVLTKDIGVTFVVHDTGMVTTVTLGRLHDVPLRFPWPDGGTAHGIAKGLWTAGGGIAEVIQSVALIEPRSFLIVLNMVVELHDVALQGDHIVVQADIVGVGIAPVHIGLSVVIDKHGGVDVVPVFLLPYQRFAERILEGPVGRIA